VRGFGIDLEGSPGNCFQIGSKLEANGIGDILNIYRSAIQQTFDMSLSKDWSVVISNAVDFARKNQNDAHVSGVLRNYTVLLILSNEPVDNINATIDALHEAASVPLSVVVVGIGDSDFSEITQSIKGVGNEIITFVNFHDDPGSMQKLGNIALFNVVHQLEHYFI